MAAAVRNLGTSARLSEAGGRWPWEGGGLGRGRCERRPSPLRGWRTLDTDPAEAFFGTVRADRFEASTWVSRADVRGVELGRDPPNMKETGVRETEGEEASALDANRLVGAAPL